MKLIIDTHTHTISSGHAYSTVQEMAVQAARKGIAMFAITDHGPALPGAPHIFHFANMRVIPDFIEGVRVLKGVEANILNYNGGIDIPESILKRLDFVLASYHDVCIGPSSVEEHTTGMIKALENPYVDAVAHPGNPLFQVDIEKIVNAAGRLNKMIEINNHSFNIRTGSEQNCVSFAQLCRKHSVKIVCGSDAHISYDIGNFDNVTKILQDTCVPRELVVNTSTEKMEQYLYGRARQY